MCGKEGNWNQTRDHIKANHMSNVIIVKRPLQQEMATQKSHKEGVIWTGGKDCPVVRIPHPEYFDNPLLNLCAPITLIFDKLVVRICRRDTPGGRACPDVNLKALSPHICARDHHRHSLYSFESVGKTWKIYFWGRYMNTTSLTGKS